LILLEINSEDLKIATQSLEEQPGLQISMEDALEILRSKYL